MTEPTQLTVFGTETPTSEIPRMNCTRDDDCPAEADEHTDDCPVEQRLKETFGY